MQPDKPPDVELPNFKDESDLETARVLRFWARVFFFAMLIIDGIAIYLGWWSADTRTAMIIFNVVAVLIVIALFCTACSYQETYDRAQQPPFKVPPRLNKPKDAPGIF